MVDSTVSWFASSPVKGREEPPEMTPALVEYPIRKWAATISWKPQALDRTTHVIEGSPAATRKYQIDGHADMPCMKRLILSKAKYRELKVGFALQTNYQCRRSGHALETGRVKVGRQYTQTQRFPKSLRSHRFPLNKTGCGSADPKNCGHDQRSFGGRGWKCIERDLKWKRDGAGGRAEVLVWLVGRKGPGL